jgi:hypothetical protein
MLTDKMLWRTFTTMKQGHTNNQTEGWKMKASIKSGMIDSEPVNYTQAVKLAKELTGNISPVVCLKVDGTNWLCKQEKLTRFSFIF